MNTKRLAKYILTTVLYAILVGGVISGSCSKSLRKEALEVPVAKVKPLQDTSEVKYTPESTIIWEVTTPMQALRNFLNSLNYTIHVPDTGEVYDSLVFESVKTFQKGFNNTNYGQDFTLVKRGRDHGKFGPRSVEAAKLVYDWCIENGISSEEEKEFMISLLKKIAEDKPYNKRSRK